MNPYIRERLRNDAAALVAAATTERHVTHPGLRGRFRELLLERLLRPWLPAYATAGTGMIVDWEGQYRESTQEDIVIFDSSTFPQVKLSESGSEGLFPVDGVLLRVEVKSTLTRAELKKAVRAAGDVYGLKFGTDNKHLGWGAASAIFAYASDLTGDPGDELGRLIDISKEEGLYYEGTTPEIPGPISALCVAGRGCWTYGGSPARWRRAVIAQPHDEILHFVGVMSNSSFAAHILRQGGRLDRGATGGIGRYIMSDETHEIDERDPPRPGVRGEVHRFAPAWKDLMQETIKSKFCAPGCPHCGGKSFHPGDDIFTPVRVADGGYIDDHGQIIPLMFIMCTNCGLTLWFSAKQLGLTWTMPA
jgi:hypothetical protein